MSDHYAHRIFRTAWEDTRRNFNAYRLLAGIGSMGGGAVALLVLSGGFAGMSMRGGALPQIVLSGLAGLLFTFLAFFLFSLIQAPAQIDKAQRQTIEKLNSAQASTDKRLRLKHILGKAYAQGETLLGEEDALLLAWMAATKNTIQDALGKGEGEFFMSDAGTIFLGGTPTKNVLTGRLTRLRELIARADSVSIRTDWDGLGVTGRRRGASANRS